MSMAKNDISELKEEIEWPTNLCKIIYLEYAIGRCPLLWRWIQVNAMNQNYDEISTEPTCILILWTSYSPETYPQYPVPKRPIPSPHQEYDKHAAKSDS